MVIPDQLFAKIVPIFTDFLGNKIYTKSEFEPGDLVEVVVIRDEAELAFDVEARVVNSPDVLMKNVHQWISKDGDVDIENIHGSKTFAFKFDGKDGQAFG